MKGISTRSYLFRARIVQIHIFVCALIASFAPLTILNDVPVLASFTGAFKAMFFPIAAYTRNSQFPQVAELYFSLMWLFSPIYFYYGLIEVRENWQAWRPKGWGQWLKLFLIYVCLMPILAIFEMAVNPGYDFHLLPINSSRSALAFGGILLSGAAGAYLLSTAVGVGERLFKLIGKFSSNGS